MRGWRRRPDRSVPGWWRAARRRLAWRSEPGADVDNAGEVVFEDAPGGRGTEVHVHLSYRPPAGAAGKAAARLLNPVFEQMVKEDIRRFKHVLEAGELPTTAGQPKALRVSSTAWRKASCSA